MVLPTSRVSTPTAVKLCSKYLHSNPQSCASIVILNTVSLTVKILITPSQLEAVFYNLDHMCRPSTLSVCQSCLFCHTFDGYDYHYLHHDEIYHRESYERAETTTKEKWILSTLFSSCHAPKRHPKNFLFFGNTFDEEHTPFNKWLFKRMIINLSEHWNRYIKDWKRRFLFRYLLWNHKERN